MHMRRCVSRSVLIRIYTGKGIAKISPAEIGPIQAGLSEIRPPQIDFNSGVIFSPFVPGVTVLLQVNYVI